MYSIDESTGPKVKYIQAGIQENLTLVSILRENSKEDGSGKQVLRFHFSNAADETFTHTEFPIDAEQLKTLAKGWSGADPDTVVKQAFEDLGARVKHILGAFLPEDVIKINAAGWEDYCDKVVALAGDLYKDLKVRLKIVLNNKDYTILPKKTITDFIQPMDVPNTLKITKYDRIIEKAPTAESQYGDDDGTGDAGDDVFEDEF